MREELSDRSPTGDCKIVEQSTQTTPRVWPAKREPKRNIDENALPKLPTPKRSKQNPLKKNPTENPPADEPDEPDRNSNANNEDNEWIAVNKKRRMKTRLRKPKPDTMIISVKEDISYADILKKIRSDPELKELGDEVNKVRRTQKGDLLFELKAGNKDVAEKFNEKIVTALNGSVEVRTRKEETVIECKDMDDITTKLEICQALSKALDIPVMKEASVRSIRKSYGGTQIAKISLPTETARRALNLNKIKIGWSVCRIREAITLTKCYRCLEFGHISKLCKSEVDRSHICIKCGLEGHIAKNCEGEACCILCKSNGNPELMHVAGSYRCPVFKKALSERFK